MAAVLNPPRVLDHLRESWADLLSDVRRDDGDHTALRDLHAWLGYSERVVADDHAQVAAFGQVNRDIDLKPLEVEPGDALKRLGDARHMFPLRVSRFQRSPDVFAAGVNVSVRGLEPAMSHQRLNQSHVTGSTIESHPGRVPQAEQVKPRQPRLRGVVQKQPFGLALGKRPEPVLPPHRIRVRPDGRRELDIQLEFVRWVGAVFQLRSTEPEPRASAAQMDVARPERQRLARSYACIHYKRKQRVIPIAVDVPSLAHGGQEPLEFVVGQEPIPGHAADHLRLSLMSLSCRSMSLSVATYSRRVTYRLSMAPTSASARTTVAPMPNSTPATSGLT